MAVLAAGRLNLFGHGVWFNDYPLGGPCGICDTAKIVNRSTAVNAYAVGEIPLNGKAQPLTGYAEGEEIV